MLSQCNLKEIAWRQKAGRIKRLFKAWLEEAQQLKLYFLKGIKSRLRVSWRVRMRN